MAVVKGVNEVVHLPLYDSVFVRRDRRLKDVISSNVLKFFVNIQGKTKLETNMQSSALLPHWNTFEARALRVVISDFPEADPANGDHAANGNGDGHDLIFEEPPQELTINQVQSARESLDAFRFAIKEAKSIPKDHDGCLGLLRHFWEPVRTEQMLLLLSSLRSVRDDLTTILTRTKVQTNKPAAVKRFLDELQELDPKGEEQYLATKLDRAGDCLDDFMTITDVAVKVSSQDLKPIEACVDAAEKILKAPAKRINAKERWKAPGLNRQRGHKILSSVLYNSVTTLFVGEKIMIQMPTWFFPAGAGPYSESAAVVTNGLPTPQATFKFAEPVTIDTQQHFRVEIEIPDADVFNELQSIDGPLFIWVVLDGYMTRDVQ